MQTKSQVHGQTQRKQQSGQLGELAWIDLRVFGIQTSLILLNMKNHSTISYPSPKPSYLCPPPLVKTGYAQTNRPGQIGLNQYYDYCRCHHQHSFQRNGWTLKILLLCLITPQTKSGSAGNRPTLVDAKNAFIRPN